MKLLRNFFFSFCQRSQKVAEPKHWTSVFCLATCAQSFLSYSNRFGFFFFPFPSCRQVSVSIEICTIATQVSHTLRCNTSWLRFSLRKLGLEIFTPLSARCCECVFDFNASKMTRRERKEVCFGTRLVASVLLCGRCWCSELMRLKKKRYQAQAGRTKFLFLLGKTKSETALRRLVLSCFAFLFWCLSSAVARGGRFREVWCN